MVTQQNKKWESLLRLGIGLALLVVLNLVANRFLFRLDLTEEKRYTVQPATRAILSNLEAQVYVEVYLEGDFNPEFKRLQKSVEETLQQFQAYAGSKLVYRFVKPDMAESAEARKAFYLKLARLGINPTTVFDDQEGQRVEKLVFPGALVSYRGKEQGVQLLKGNRSAGSSQVLNQSIEGLEYELATAIRNLSQTERSKVGIISNHLGLDSLELMGMVNSLADRHDVYRADLNKLADLSVFDALLLVKPTSAYSEAEKYRLDAYVTQGGNLFVAIDQMGVKMEEASEGTVAYTLEHNLDDLLFRYGVRINQDLIQDVQCGNFPVVVGDMGDQPQITMLPWPYFPVSAQYGQHPIVRNLDASLLRFASTIDTVKATGIRKTPLMYSSPYARVMTSPIVISFNDLREGLNPKLFNAGIQPVAYLLEGQFTSVFKNRMLPEGVSPASNNQAPGKVLVMADGDFVRNEVDIKSGKPHPLGFDQFARQSYANNDFMLNAISYLVEEEGLITARSKEVKVRPLDKVKVAKDKLFWQLVNVALPLLMLVVAGVLVYFWRKRKYSSF